MIQTIFLDLDGPLLDGKVRHHQCYADILNAHGFTPIDIETYWFIKRNRCSMRELLARSGAESLYDVFLEQWLKNIELLTYLKLDRLQLGVIAKLQEWLSNRLQMVLVTMRKNSETLLTQLGSVGLKKYLSEVIVCDHAHGGVGKAEAIKKVFPEIHAVTSLWIGDTEVDYEGARYLGCPVWMVLNGLRARDYLESLHPDYLSESIIDIDLNGK